MIFEQKLIGWSFPSLMNMWHSKKVMEIAEDIAAQRWEHFKKQPIEKKSPFITDSQSVKGVFEHRNGLQVVAKKYFIYNKPVLKSLFDQQFDCCVPSFFHPKEARIYFEVNLIPFGYQTLYSALNIKNQIPKEFRKMMFQVLNKSFRHGEEWFVHGHLHTDNILVKLNRQKEWVDIKFIDWKKLVSKPIYQVPALLQFIQGNRQALAGQHFDRRILLEWFNLDHADLSDTNLKKSILIGTSFQGSLIKNTNFSGARLDNALFSQSNLENPFWHKTRADLLELDQNHIDLIRFEREGFRTWIYSQRPD